MATPRDVVNAVYQRFAEGDTAGFLALCAEDIEWVVNGPAALEKCQAFRGRDGVQAFLHLLAGWEFSTFAPREFIVEGATVVVLGEETGTDTRSGLPFSNRWVHVFDVRDGRIQRFREFLCHWMGSHHPPPMSWGMT